MPIEKNNVVIIEYEFKAPLSKVFDAILEGRLFYNCGAWPQTTKIDSRGGGKYHLDFGHYGSTTGEFTEVIKDQRICFSWNPLGMDLQTRVTIEFSGDSKSCKVKLRHEGFSDREMAQDHEGGWTGGLVDMDAEMGQRRIKIDRQYFTPVEALFKACSGMAFFNEMGAHPTKSKVDFRVGGTYECVVPGDRVIRGKFTEIVPNEKIVFTWDASPCGVELDRPSLVTLEFGPMGEGNKHSYLCLTHEGFTKDEQVLSHHEGWSSVTRKMYDRSRL